jgi:hypothetical protein
MPIVLKSGILRLLEPSEPVQACTVVSIPLHLYIYMYIYIYIDIYAHTYNALFSFTITVYAAWRAFVYLFLCSNINKMMMMLIITIAGDPFSDHNVNNVIEDSLGVFGFSVLEASPFTIGQSSLQCRPTCLILQ